MVIEIEGSSWEPKMTAGLIIQMVIVRVAKGVTFMIMA